MPIVEKKYRGTKEYAVVYGELMTAARYRGVVTYQEVAKLIGWALQGNRMGSEIGHLLGEISEDETDMRRPMLSAIVVTVSGTPGPGFFKLARALNRLKGEGDAAETEFLKCEQHAVHETWRVILPRA